MFWDLFFLSTNPLPLAGHKAATMASASKRDPGPFSTDRRCLDPVAPASSPDVLVLPVSLLTWCFSAALEEFYVRYYVGHKGKFGHEFLEFEFRPNGLLRYGEFSHWGSRCSCSRATAHSDEVAPRSLISSHSFRLTARSPLSFLPLPPQPTTAPTNRAAAVRT